MKQIITLCRQNSRLIVKVDIEDVFFLVLLFATLLYIVVFSKFLLYSSNVFLSVLPEPLNIGYDTCFAFLEALGSDKV
jgi:hypothetical protein